jgi:hypothetical protein
MLSDVQSLSVNRAAAPMRKFRGKRRYFEGVDRQALAFRLRIEPDAWWDLWHYHADWPGWGNRRWKYRLRHLRALAVVFEKIAELAPSMGRPFQLWISINGEDAGQDATFLHSPNPNGTPFPLRLEQVVWSDEGPRGAALARLLPGHRLRFGRTSWVDPDDPARRLSSWLVCSPEIGVPLESA